MAAMPYNSRDVKGVLWWSCVFHVGNRELLKKAGHAQSAQTGTKREACIFHYLKKLW